MKPEETLTLVKGLSWTTAQLNDKKVAAVMASMLNGERKLMLTGVLKAKDRDGGMALEIEYTAPSGTLQRQLVSQFEADSLVESPDGSFIIDP